MLGLRFRHEGLLGSVPIMDIITVNGFQFVGIDVLVAVTNGLSSAGQPHFLTLIKQHIKIMGMEYPPPEASPVVTCPYIQALIVS